MTIIGELAATLAAFSYASSSNLYSLASVKHCSPFLLNSMKGIVSGSVMLILLILFANQIFPEDTFNNYFLLILSGIFGIGIGDSFYFKALNLLGPRQTILLECLAPPFTGLISYFYYGSTLSLLGWIGIFVTGYGVYMVVNEQQENEESSSMDEALLVIRNDHDNEQTTELSVFSSNASEEIVTKLQEPQILKQTQHLTGYFSGDQAWGLVNGFAFTFCQSLGMVFSHDAAQTGKFTSLQSSLLRMVSGLACVILIIASKREKFYWPCESKKTSYFFLSGIAVGPFLGIWSQQTSLLYTRPEIAQTIIATSPLFGLIISWFRGEQMKVKFILGSLISIIGVSMIIWF